MILQNLLSLPNDGIKLQVSNTKAFVGNDSIGTGTLCVAESNLIWINENGDGLFLEYPQIALHAISNDLNAFPHECIYVMLDKNQEEENDDEDEDNSNITEIRFVPEDKTTLNPLFLAINHCQSLHPDDFSNSDIDEENGDVVDEENGNGDYHEEQPFDYDDGNDDECINGDVELSVRGQQILQRIQINYEPNENNGSDNEQFEDAD